MLYAPLKKTKHHGHNSHDAEFIEFGLLPFIAPLMASQKVRPTALRRFFRTPTYLMYAFSPEKPPSLAGRNFCLAI